MSMHTDHVKLVTYGYFLTLNSNLLKYSISEYSMTKKNNKKDHYCNRIYNTVFRFKDSTGKCVKQFHTHIRKRFMQRFVQSGYHVEFDPDTIMAIEPETFFVISKSKGHIGPIRALVAPIRIYLPPNKPIWAIYVSLMYIFDSPISPFWPLLSSFFLNKVLICHFGTLLAHPLQYGTLFYPFGPL